MKATQKLNIMFWSVLAVILMVTDYCNWEHYSWMSFLASLCMHGGLCAVMYYFVDKKITKERKYFTFYDLEWAPWTEDEHLTQEFLDSKQARMDFDNGYGISVLSGTPFHSDDYTYEVRILKDGKLKKVAPYDTCILGYRTPDQITQIMEYLQKL